MPAPGCQAAGTVHVCVNDTGGFPPAIGAQPPGRFWQGVRA
ncbi:MAG TPA: hypothetical protein VG123_08005 [Streptosporangiaceae bacterium]|nr:hypothetical protein [Streptosporangiaceae bacterium]